MIVVVELVQFVLIMEYVSTYTSSFRSKY